MPFINGVKVPFDPYKIAEALHQRKEVEADYVTDAESFQAQEDRRNQEWEIVLKQLEKYFPESLERILNPNGPYRSLWPNQSS